MMGNIDVSKMCTYYSWKWKLNKSNAYLRKNRNNVWFFVIKQSYEEQKHNKPEKQFLNLELSA